MAAPTFVSAGTGAIWQSGAGVTASLAGTTAGNLILLQVLVDTGTGDAVTLGSITNLENLAGTDGAMTTISDVGTSATVNGLGTIGGDGANYLYAGRSLGGTVSLTATGGAVGFDLYFRLYEFTNVNAGTALSDIMENAGSEGNASGAGNGIWRANREATAAVTDQQVITNGADRLAVQLIAVNDDNPLVAFTGMTGGTWTEPVAEFASATGTDGAIGINVATMASAGTINGGSQTMAAADPWNVIGFALIPPAAGAVSDPTSWINERRTPRRRSLQRF